MSMVSRRVFLSGLAAGVLGASRPSLASPLTNLWQGIDLQQPDGRLFQLRDIQRRVVVVKLWANWCPACLGELASLTAMAGVLDPMVEIVLVSHPEFWERDQRTARARGVPFRLATLAANTSPGVAAAALLDASGDYTVPRTIAFRADATQAWTHLGAMSWSGPDALARVRSWTA